MGDQPSLETRVQQIMHEKLTSHQRWLATIWAARDRHCSECGAVPYNPCLNLTDVKKKVVLPKLNKWPHSSRVDWSLLMDQFKKRGWA